MKGKVYFADEYSCYFFGDGTLTKLQIDFDCLFEGKWNGNKTVLCKDVKEVFTEFEKMGYEFFLDDVPEKDEVVNWLESVFGFNFYCNDNPCHYADTSDVWTTISRKIEETSLCPEGNAHCDRYIRFENNWLEILDMIEKNDVVARTESARVTYDDIDWNQKKEPCGVCSGNGNLAGKEFIPVEKKNVNTTALLREIAVPRTIDPVSWEYKYTRERWFIESIKWDVKEEIASKYGVKIEIEQGSLYYRGTWIDIRVKAVGKKYAELREICRRFCSDYGFDTRRELIILNGYELPWTDEQKERSSLDDDADFMFESMDFGDDD